MQIRQISKELKGDQVKDLKNQSAIETMWKIQITFTGS